VAVKSWSEAVHSAVQRHVQRTGSTIFSRQGLIDSEMDAILAATGSVGATPWQTLSQSVDRLSQGMNPDAMLREEIGDSDYEKYLEAQGRPTSVGVASVMASSPADRAGLQSGDEIVGYDGKRVFSSYELMQQTMTAGDGNVVVDVVRDGAPLQIVVPRGPIGVEIGRFRGR
jgi:hypothetical protein